MEEHPAAMMRSRIESGFIRAEGIHGGEDDRRLGRDLWDHEAVLQQTRKKKPVKDTLDFFHRHMGYH